MLRLDYPGIIGSGDLYLQVMKAICGDTEGKSMIDLMCYHAPYTPLLGFDKRTYIDIQDRGLDHKEEQPYFKQDDVLECLSSAECQFHDVSICSDGLEHLEESHAIFLLKKMYLYSSKQILFTPFGEVMITTDENPDSHRSGWTPEKLEYIMHNHFAYIVFPDFHKSINAGAFFFWHTKDIQQDFERVKKELIELDK